MHVAEVHNKGTAQYGPIVMKTDAELEQAYAELRNGTSSSNVTNEGTLCRSREDTGECNELDACTGTDTRRQTVL